MAQPIKKELRHVVLFGWKAVADTSEIRRVVTAFKALPGQINTIKHFEWGVNKQPRKPESGSDSLLLCNFCQ